MPTEGPCPRKSTRQRENAPARRFATATAYRSRLVKFLAISWDRRNARRRFRRASCFWHAGRHAAEKDDANKTVVLVEDDHHIADLVDLYLRKAGYRVLQASDATRGRELITNERPQLVLVDIGLPGPIDGVELCREIRKTSDVPVVFLTARYDEVDRVLGLELGADDYITKPFSPRARRRARHPEACRWSEAPAFGADHRRGHHRRCGVVAR